MNIQSLNHSHPNSFEESGCNCYCQFVPPHIFHDLAILNGESFGGAPRISTRLHTIIAEPSRSSSTVSPAKKVDIKETAQMIRAYRAVTSGKSLTSVASSAATTHTLHMSSTAASPARHSATTTALPTPSFPVYDLDGATDLEDENRVPEYKKKIVDASKLSGTPDDANWPANAKRAAKTAQKVFEFFKSEFGRNSINNAGMNIASCVRLRAAVITYNENGEPTIARDQGGNIIRVPENNAFWDGKVMAYGEGDNMIFEDFTASEDVVAHELTHGVTQFTCNLRYAGQSGALNEHISDVFGAMFRHKDKGMSDPTQANWLIGDDCIDDDFKKMVQIRKFGYWDALRSMKDPGNAYAVIKGNSRGRDPQPAHMHNYLEVDYDNGGVHLNSGIPNKAFYLFTIAVGEPSWKMPGQVWYKTISESKFGKIEKDPHTNIYDRVTTFKEFATATLVVVKRDFPQSEAKLLDAWKQVGVL